VSNVNHQYKKADGWVPFIIHAFVQDGCQLHSFIDISYTLSITYEDLDAEEEYRKPFGDVMSVESNEIDDQDELRNLVSYGSY
jgi:hypothetical protein